MDEIEKNEKARIIGIERRLFFVSHLRELRT